MLFVTHTLNIRLFIYLAEAFPKQINEHLKWSPFKSGCTPTVSLTETIAYLTQYTNATKPVHTMYSIRLPLSIYTHIHTQNTHTTRSRVKCNRFTWPLSSIPAHCSSVYSCQMKPALHLHTVNNTVQSHAQWSLFCVKKTWLKTRTRASFILSLVHLLIHHCYNYCIQR